VDLSDRVMGSPPGPESVGDGRKSASKICSSTILRDCCTTRSVTVGVPNGRDFPPGFGINTRRTGEGRYVPSLSAEAIPARNAPTCPDWEI
jgi:hypothetical protein